MTRSTFHALVRIRLHTCRTYATGGKHVRAERARAVYMCNFRRSAAGNGEQRARAHTRLA